MPLRTKIAFFCDRMGPYHYARLYAASRYAEIIVIEFSAVDQTYAWDVIEATGNFQRVTLFRDDPLDVQPISEVMRRVAGVLDEVSPQVVAIPGWDASASLVALWWCLHTNTPTILMSDSQEHDEVRVWWKESIKRRIVKLHTSGFVAGTSHIAYLKSLGMPEIKIFTGCDVVDNTFFAEKARAARLDSVSMRKKFCLPRWYFLASCRFIQKKNLFFLLKSYAVYCQKAGNAAGNSIWNLVILGDGPLMSQIIRFRDKLGLADKVILPGFRQYEELPVYYGLAGAFVHASTSEQWGLVVNEAMASGLPVIVSTPCGCSPDLVRHGHNGFTFDPNDVAALSQHLTCIAGDKCDRDAMGEASQSIIADWSLETFTMNLLKATKVALDTPKSCVGYLNKALLWGLIHRHVINAKSK